MPKTLFIIYYSNTGKTEKMASHIARGAEKAGVNAILKKVEDCMLNDLAEADGITVGSAKRKASSKENPREIPNNL